MPLNWFRKAAREPGWMAVSIADEDIGFVHGQFMPKSRPVVHRCALQRIEAVGSVEAGFKDESLGRYDCVTLLKPGDYQMLLVEAPNVPREELRSAIRWRVKELLDYHVEDAMIDVLDIPPPAETPGRAHSMFAVAARNEVIQNTIRRFEQAQVPLSVIDIPETAQRNVAALYEEEGRAIALLYFDSAEGLLTINYRTELYMARRIDIGVAQIAGASDSDAQAELLGRVLLEVQRTFDHFERQYPEVGISALLLAPEPRESGLLDYLADNLGLPVRSVDLQEVIEFDRDAKLDVAQQWRLFHLVGTSLRYETRAL